MPTARKIRTKRVAIRTGAGFQLGFCFGKRRYRCSHISRVAQKKPGNQRAVLMVRMATAYTQNQRTKSKKGQDLVGFRIKAGRSLVKVGRRLERWP